MVIEVRKVVTLVMGEGIIDWKRNEGAFWSVGNPLCLHLAGGYKSSMYIQTHCHQADISVSASCCIQLDLNEQQYCPKCRQDLIPVVSISCHA